MTLQQIEELVTDWSYEKRREKKYKNMFTLLVVRWKKVVDSNGEYIIKMKSKPHH